MIKNIGKTDRVIRLIIGHIIMALGFYYQSWWGLLAAVPMGTAVLGFCGLYRLLGLNTCKRKK